jgi:hypothetical protein
MFGLIGGEGSELPALGISYFAFFIGFSGSLLSEVGSGRITQKRK